MTEVTKIDPNTCQHTEICSPPLPLNTQVTACALGECVCTFVDVYAKASFDVCSRVIFGRIGVPLMMNVHVVNVCSQTSYARVFVCQRLCV